MDWRQKLLNAAKVQRYNFGSSRYRPYKTLSKDESSRIERVVINDNFDKAYRTALSSISERDQEITSLFYQGSTCFDLACKYNTSATKILQIVQNATQLLLRGNNLDLFLPEEDKIKDESAQTE